jgi:hypothetical protein
MAFNAGTFLIGLKERLRGKRYVIPSERKKDAHPVPLGLHLIVWIRSLSSQPLKEVRVRHTRSLDGV